MRCFVMFVSTDLEINVADKCNQYVVGSLGYLKLNVRSKDEKLCP